MVTSTTEDAVVAQASPELLGDFAQCLENARMNAYEDDFAIVNDFRALASKNAIDALDNSQDEKFAAFEREARLWQLVDLLYRFRASQPEPVPSVRAYNSNAIVHEQHLRQNLKSRENWVILGWLQDTLEAPSEPEEMRSVKWMYTKSKVKQRKLPNLPKSQMAGLGAFGNLKADASQEKIVTELDSDAPLRQGASIDPDDAQFDRTFFKYVFELLLARKYDEAATACEKTGNWDLKVVLAGRNEYVDPEIDGDVLGWSDPDSMVPDTDPTGTDNKALWQWMCRQLAQLASGLDSYERGIYGFLGGNLESVLPLCDSWETQFVAYLSYLVACESSKVLAESGRVDPKLVQTSDAPISSAHQVLDILAQSSHPIVRDQSTDHVRSLMGAVINNTVGYVANEGATSLAEVMEGIQESSELTENEQLLRVLTHLLLFIQTVDSVALLPASEESIAVIIRAYIELLSMRGQGQSVPLYVSFLPPSLAVETYSFLLANTTDPAQRKTHLQLGAKFGLDMPNSIRAGVQRVFQQTSQTASHSALDGFTAFGVGVTGVVSDEDIRLYRAVEWFVDASMWPDAVHSIVALYRHFLSLGKLGAALEFNSRVKSATIVKRFDAASINPVNKEEYAKVTAEERAEILEYDRLMVSFDLVSQWDNHSTSREQSRTWQQASLRIVEATSASVHELTSNWLLAEGAGAISQSGPVVSSPELEDLRTIYLPYLVLELARVLIEAQSVHPGFLRQAAELAVLVSDDSLDLADLFVRAGLVDQLLIRIADAVTDGVSRGEEGIFGEVAP